MKIIIWLFSVVLLFQNCSGEDNPSPSPPTPNPPVNTTYTDVQIIDMVQKDALKYFWDYAETNSKLARERYHTDNTALDANIM